MKRIVLTLAMLIAASTSARADIIAQWTFEASAPAGVGPHVAEAGGNASGSFATSVGLGTISSPAGNGSVESFSANGWDVGDYFQFTTSTTGYEDITLSWEQTGSGTGPAEFTLAYSTDGSSFTNFADYTVAPNANPPGFWNNTTFIPGYTRSFDLASVTSLDDAAQVFFRLTQRTTLSLNGGTVGSGGTGRVDDFTINGALMTAGVPEPSSMLLSGVAFAGAAVMRRRRKAPVKAAQA